MASETTMGASAFHQHFKTITTSSPLQCITTTRLHKARLLMVQEGPSVSEAAARVGHESSSQFSRELKRHFGRPPAEETARLRSLYSAVMHFATGSYPVGYYRHSMRGKVVLELEIASRVLRVLRHPAAPIALK